MAYADVVLADAPLVYWRLGESSGTVATDSSGNGKNGTYNGSPALGATGLTTDPDKAVTFDGVNDYVAYAEASIPTAFTIEAWVKVSASVTGYIANRFPSTTTDRIFYLQLNTGRVDFTIVSSTGTTSSAVMTAAISSNVAHHVVATFQAGDALRVYVDGVQVVSTANTSWTFRSVPSALTVGARTGGAATFFNGVIDEVAYYPTALSSTRVAAHYTAGTAAGTTTGTVAGTLSMPTASVAGAVLPPPVTGTTAGTLAVPTAGLAGGVGLPGVNGSVAGTLAAPAGSFSGGFIPPTVTGAVAGVVGSPIADLAADAALPPAIAGALDAILDLPTAYLTGDQDTSGLVTGTVDWALGDPPGGTLEPIDNGSGGITFPDVDLDPGYVYTFALSLESLGGAAVEVTVGGTTVYDSLSDPNVPDATDDGELLQVLVVIGPGVSGSPVFTVTQATVWSVEWDGGVLADADLDGDVDPVFAALPEVAVLHIIAPSVPIPTLVNGRPV